MDIQQQDFYQKLRARIMAWLRTEKGMQNKWAQYLLLAPDFFHLLCKLVIDQDVHVADKAKLVGAIAYFMSPVDLMPEAILGPVGYLDDLALAAFVLNAIVNHTNPAVVRRHWAGEGDVLAAIQSVLAVADRMIGTGLWNRLKSRFKGY